MATNYAIGIDQGTTWRLTVTVNAPGTSTPMDLTGYTAKMHIRPTTTSSTLLLELSTTNGRITLGGAAGTINLKITHTDTADLTFDQAVYDLEIYAADGEVTRLLQGTVSVSKEVTR